MNSSPSSDFQGFEMEPLPSEMRASELDSALPARNGISGETDEVEKPLYNPEPLELRDEPPLPVRAQTLFRRGLAALRAGEADEALEIWRGAHAEFPTSATIAHNLGLAEGAAQQYGAALTAFREAYELDGTLMLSNINAICAGMSWMQYQARAGEALEQCEALRGEGQQEEAEEVVRQLLDEYPDSAAGHTELCITLCVSARRESGYDQELLEQALDHARRAIFLAPERAAGFYATAMAQSALGMHRDSVVSAQRSLVLQPDADSLLRLFVGEETLRVARLENGDLQLTQQALEYADQVLADEPDNLRACLLRAQANGLRAANGVIEFAENLADFERVLQLDPDNSGAMEARNFLRAHCHQEEVSNKLGPIFDEALNYLEAGENEKALPLLRRILEADPDNRATLNNLSLSLRRLKRLDEALPIQTRLAQIDSTPEAWRMVAAIALQDNRYEEANKAYVQVAQLLPDEARAHGAVATTLEQMERREESIPHWRRVLELAPDDDVAWFHLGENLLETGRASDPVNEDRVHEALPALKRAHALDTEHLETLSQLAIAHAEVGQSETALDYASRLAIVEPQTHSDLLQTLTGIQSRRLAEGLASRPANISPLPPLMPPPLPVEHTDTHLHQQPFSVVPRRSLSPLLVGVIGLVAIFGLWVAMRMCFPPPPLFVDDAVPPPNMSPAVNSGLGVDSGTSSANPPVTAPVSPSEVTPAPFINTPIMGRWAGTFNQDSAHLLISNRDINNFSGTLFIDSGASAGLQIQIEGVLSDNSISWSETKILSNPRNSGWSLGKEVGNVTRNGIDMWMSGDGSDNSTTYKWNFRRLLSSTPSPTATTTTASVTPTEWETTSESDLGFSLAHPVGWTRAVESHEGRERVSFNAPQGEARLIIDVMPPASDSALTVWQAENKRLSHKYGSDYRLLNLGEAPLGGEPGAKWQFILKKPGETQLRKIDRGVVHNGRGYALLMVAPAKEFEDWLPTFGRVVDSFSFQ